MQLCRCSLTEQGYIDSGTPSERSTKLELLKRERTTARLVESRKEFRLVLSVADASRLQINLTQRPKPLMPGTNSDCLSFFM